MPQAAEEGADGQEAEEGQEGQEGEEGHAADPSVTHVFVAAPADALPPLFVPQGVGYGPNGGVWGHCRGGDPADAVGTCPIPPIEGPASWDGTAYWSTGALLPGETADVPLAADVPDGRYALVCALHPELRVEVDVGAEASPLEAPAPRVPGPDAMAAAVPQDAATVVAGARVEDGDALGVVDRFLPAEISIGVGEEVTWRAGGRDPHDVNLGLEEAIELVDSQPDEALPGGVEDGAWDGTGPARSGYLTTDPAGPTGDRFTLRFTEPGTYAYVCRFHPSMAGVVEVTGP